jgi:hypothetical protein
MCSNGVQTLSGPNQFSQEKSTDSRAPLTVPASRVSDSLMFALHDVGVAGALCQEQETIRR